ncbi:RNA polymerase sigma factor [Winogradskyella sp. PG-2]|uniref:RNA polymerase sigma factor n=1 Tax=Winogradskyella sp. PG-2 TaxID=754409 RepID=UPI00045886D7|nr:RNA polymerase sigma factor [Winogradskyella sp. PG-2]BAO74439.1 RNA polymerase ECF-type sigma factor [Winogradskyella sp. PG-2]
MCNQSKTETKISTFQIHIVEKCKQNDRQAQMQLYNQYCNGMLIVALRFVKDTMEAEDIVQEAFIKAFSKLEQYKAEVSFGAWLKRIVINRCIDVLKSKRQRLIELEEHHLNVVDADYENEWLVDDAITIDEVKAAIERLPEKYKIVVMLYLIEGYDHQEISEVLNITEVASRTQLSRGKQKLQNELKLEKNGTRS